jgi:hypothetical protein
MVIPATSASGALCDFFLETVIQVVVHLFDELVVRQSAQIQIVFVVVVIVICH